MKLKLLFALMFIAMAAVLLWWVVVMDEAEPGRIILDLDQEPYYLNIEPGLVRDSLSHIPDTIYQSTEDSLWIDHYSHSDTAHYEFRASHNPLWGTTWTIEDVKISEPNFGRDPDTIAGEREE